MLPDSTMQAIMPANAGIPGSFNATGLRPAAEIRYGAGGEPAMGPESTP